ncbi:MAG: glycoside hydrolase family 25 protein [Deltaproteobacteria bacterium]|nr:glycoside hydrolase family 25 protein [Deltaproteobacteria bacterium]
MSVKRVVKLLLVVSILSLVAYFYYINFEPDRKLFPIRGIDISHHQGQINWDLVSKNDVQFVFIKASEGRDFKDTNFLTNWNNAKNAGILRGAYHFFSLCASGREQAANFIAAVPVEVNTLPPVVDLEYGGNCANRPDKAELTKQLRDYSEEIEKHYNRKPFFYVTRKFYKQYLLSNEFFDYSEYPLWVRGIITKPDDKMGWVIWQYHNRGHVDGIETPVDLNVWRAGDHLEQWLQ